VSKASLFSCSKVVVVGQRSILVGLDGERLDVMEKGLTKG
jgi:hypothetical protein